MGEFLTCLDSIDPSGNMKILMVNEQEKSMNEYK